MSSSLLSDQSQLLIAGYVLGTLDISEAEEFEQLLANNPAIAAEVALVQQALELAYLPPDVAPPAALRSAILAAASENVRETSKDRAEHSPVSVRPPLSFRRAFPNRMPWSRAAGLAAAALIAGLGINNYRLWQTLKQTQAQQQASTLVYSLQGTDQASQAAATVTVNPDRLEAVIDVENLPPLPPGKVYVLWTVVGKETPYPTDAKGAILTQVFRVSPEGSLLQKVTVPEVYRSSNLVSKVAVTLEDASSPEEHSGPIMAITDS